MSDGSVFLECLPTLGVAALAWWVASMNKSHRVLAAYLTWFLLAEATLFWIPILAVDPTHVLSNRLLFHLSQWLQLSIYFLFIAVAAHYYEFRRVRWVAVGSWILAAVVCLDAETFSGDRLGYVYQATSLLSVVTAWAFITWGHRSRSTVRPTLAHLVIILYATSDLVLMVLPLAGKFDSDWAAVRYSGYFIKGGIGLAHIVWLAKQPKTKALPPAVVSDAR